MTVQDTDRRTLRIGHSPDPDDAFMWYPLANFTAPDGRVLRPRIDTGGYRFEHVLEDIQSLNERSERAELEITALSIHEYPYVAKDYALTSCGSSMGDGYGPMLVARQPMTLAELGRQGGGRSSKDIQPSPNPSLRREGSHSGPAPSGGRPRVAIPGKRTSAWLALQLLMAEQGIPVTGGPIDFEVVMFDQIIPEVVAGRYDAGLIIHEGQLTYGEAGLSCVVDLGKWWTDTRKLPMPLGGNAIRRDLGEAMPEICRVLLASIEWALANRQESVDFALNYARHMGHALANQFVGMYVNDWTLDYGERGREAVRRFLGEARDAGLVPDFGEIDFVEPG